MITSEQRLVQAVPTEQPIILRWNKKWRTLMRKTKYCCSLRFFSFTYEIKLPFHPARSLSDVDHGRLQCRPQSRTTDARAKRSPGNCQTSGQFLQHQPAAGQQTRSISSPSARDAPQNFCGAGHQPPPKFLRALPDARSEFWRSARLHGTCCKGEWARPE